ncbi:MAG: hypothetical protein ACI3ZD_16570 [Prevotella sp.]
MSEYLIDFRKIVAIDDYTTAYLRSTLETNKQVGKTIDCTLDLGSLQSLYDRRIDLMGELQSFTVQTVAILLLFLNKLSERRVDIAVIYKIHNFVFLKIHNFVLLRN